MLSKLRRANKLKGWRVGGRGSLQGYAFPLQKRLDLLWIGFLDFFQAEVRVHFLRYVGNSALRRAGKNEGKMTSKS